MISERTRRSVYIETILRQSASQSTLPFARVSGKGKEPMVQKKLPFDMKKSQKSLMQSVLPFKRTPQCHETQLERLRVIVMQKLSTLADDAATVAIPLTLPQLRNREVHPSKQ